MNGKDLFIIFILTALCALFFSNFNSLSIQEGNAIFESTKNQYLVSHIVSPRLAGLPLKVFGVVLNTPIVGSFIAYLLYKTNNLDLVQRFATGLSDDYIPYAYPQTSLGSEFMSAHQQLSSSSKTLFELYQELVNAKKIKTAPFSFQSTDTYTSLYKTGSVTPTQVIGQLFREIQRTNETLRAWNQLLVNYVTEQASQSTYRYQNNAPLSPLDGVPITVKDEIVMKGYYTSYGTKIFKNISSEDAISISRLKAAGAIIVGKTTMHELGLGTSGVSLPFGTPRNPYDIKKYSGGSSSGSAVAVASGLVPISIGSDGGGSVRIPASLTGLYGLKATFGRIARSPRGVCYSVCHIGPLTASFEDLILAYSVLAGPSDEDPFSVNQPPIHAAGLMSNDVSGLRVGVYPEHIENSSPEILESVRAALTFLESRGVVVVNITIPHLHVINKAHSIVITSEIGGGSFKYFKSHFFDYSPEVMLMFGMVRTYSSNDLIAAQRVRHYASRVMKDIFQRVDVIIGPTNSHTAFPIPSDVASYGESDVTSTTKQMAHAPLSNFVGYPSLSIPIGYDSNSLPIGLMVEADMWREDLLFKVAHVLDESIVSVNRKQPTAFSNILSEYL